MAIKNDAIYTITYEQSNNNYKSYVCSGGNSPAYSSNFGMVVPFKSNIISASFLYNYTNQAQYNSSDISANYSFNTNNTDVKLQLYIDNSLSDYYFEETLDISRSMIVGTFKKLTNINNMGRIISNAIVPIEANSIISFYYSELSSTDLSDNYTNYPYNPSSNRFTVSLERV